jgi:FkbM family methyltransferase
MRRPFPYEVALFAQRFLNPAIRYSLIDVGANTGNWAQRFMEYIPCDYTGFEPDPSAFRALQARFPSGNVKNVCVGESREPVNFHLSEVSTYSSKFNYDERLPSRATSSTISVDQIRLDDESFGEQPLILKIDVQGSEHDVLSGGLNTIASAVLIILEAPLFRQTQGTNSLTDVITLLHKSHFQPCYFCKGGLSLRSNTIPIEHDVLFVNTKLLDPIANLL